MPSIIFVVIYYESPSIMNPVGIISMVDPAAAPYFIRKSSLYTSLLILPANTKDVVP